MASLAAGAGSSYGLGALNKVIVDAEGGYLVVMAMSAGALLGVVAERSASLATVAYEMALFINRTNGILSPQLINELKNSVGDDRAAAAGTTGTTSDLAGPAIRRCRSVARAGRAGTAAAGRAAGRATAVRPFLVTSGRTVSATGHRRRGAGRGSTAQGSGRRSGCPSSTATSSASATSRWPWPRSRPG